MSQIPYGKQDINQQDVEAVLTVLKSDFLTQGPQIPLFEKAVSQVVNAKYAVATNSATSALHIACLALGVGEGDVVWTSPITFVASANCALYCGAKIDFVDIDTQTYNMSVVELGRKLKAVKEQGLCLPKVVIAVHLGGQSCEMDKIYRLGIEYGFSIIEDASHAIGGRYIDDPVGSCKYSDITVFSFHPVKIITTGEGGIAVTNSQRLHKQMSLYRSHGVVRDQEDMSEQSHGQWYYQQITLGYNYRMTEMQAALGISQLDRLSSYVSARHRLAIRYDELLNTLPLTTPFSIPQVYSGMHLYIIRLHTQSIKLTHKEVFTGLRDAGIGVNLHYIPVHIQPYYRQFGFEGSDFPNSMSFYSEAISLPMFPNLSVEEQDYVVEVLTNLLKESK